MVKTLRCFLMSILSLVSVCMFADEKTVDFTKESITVTDDGFTLSVNPFDFAAVKNDGSTKPTQNGNAKDLRIYAKGTFSISGPVSMTKVVFTVSNQGKKRWAELTPSSGSVTHQVDAGTITWTNTDGVAKVDFTVGDKAVYGTEGDSKAGQLDINAATITYTASDDYVASPVISGKTSFLSDTEVTISAGDGCDVYYTLDGSAPSTSSTKYSVPFSLTASTTVKAIAVKGSNSSDVVEAKFEKVTLTDATISSLNDRDEDLAWVTLKFDGAVVTYIDGKNYYLRQDDKALMLYYFDLSSHASSPIEVGDTFYGDVICDYVNYYGIHEVKGNSLTDVSSIVVTQAVVGGTAPEPTPVTVADILALKHICDYVVVNGTIVADGSNYYIVDGENKVQLYGGIDVSGFAGDGKNYNVIALFNNIYKGAAELKPLSVVDPAGINGIYMDAPDKTSIYNLAGQKLSKLSKGINIVNGKKIIK